MCSFFSVGGIDDNHDKFHLKLVIEFLDSQLSLLTQHQPETVPGVVARQEHEPLAGDKDDGPRDGNFSVPLCPDLTVTNDEKRLVVDSYHCFSSFF